MNLSTLSDVQTTILLYFAGAIPATKDWVDVVRPIIEKRIQK